MNKQQVGHVAPRNLDSNHPQPSQPCHLSWRWVETSNRPTQRRWGTCCADRSPDRSPTMINSQNLVKNQTKNIWVFQHRTGLGCLRIYLYIPWNANPSRVHWTVYIQKLWLCCPINPDRTWQPGRWPGWVLRCTLFDHFADQRMRDEENCGVTIEIHIIIPVKSSDGQLSLSTSTKPTALAKGLFLGNRGWHTSPVAVGSWLEVV